MIRGRRPTPTHLRLLQGNPQRRRLPKNEIEPALAADVPAPPAFLHAYAAEEWNAKAQELHRLRVLTRVDTMVFAAYCQSVARWRLAEEALQRMVETDQVMNGFTIMRQNGEMATNPLVVAARRAAVEMLRFAAEFGMSPAARSRVAGSFAAQMAPSKFGDLIAPR